jgi:hypothetical protein
MANRIDFTTPVGRLVGGDLYTPNTTDYQGKPLTMKDKVTPRVEYSFGVAIPKTPGISHWASEAWGGPIWALANQAFPNGEPSRPDFAFKITDGDSTIPNKRNNRPCDREGYPGHWVIWFSGGFAPGIYNADGSQKILEKDAIKPGYYVQVFGNVTDNKPSESPGLYINHTYVALAGYGPEITVGPDVSAAKFGGAPLPPGASAVPASNFAPASAPTPPAPPGAPAGGPPVYVPPAVNNAAPPPPNVAVAPNPGILTPPAPPAAPVRQLTALANGASYEQLIANGWTDETLRANGVML